MTKEASTGDDHTPVRPRAMQSWKWLIAGLVLGALLVFGVRFATFAHDKETHYHANFTVYIDGVREDFKGSQYYQEVKICDLHGSSPQARTHMHNAENGVIHVHDEAVTWGQFFENLGWQVGPDFVRTTTRLYASNEAEKLNIIINGEDLTDVTTITNTVINDKDRLLLSYGLVDQPMLQAQYKTVPSSAARYDQQKDPATCGGHEAPTISERLRHLL